MCTWIKYDTICKKLFRNVKGKNVGTYDTLNDVLVNLFRDINSIEEKAIASQEYQDLTNNDMHVINAIGIGTTKNMSSIAKELSVTVGTLTISMNSLVKKWLLGLLTAMMAVSLAACTPTTEKQKETKSAAEAQTQMEAQTTGGASDKVPDPNVAPVAIISIYHKGDGDSLVQDMDSLDSDELDPQALVNKMMEYGIFTEGTEVLDFNITGEDDNKTAVLNLNQAENNEGVSDNAFLVEIGNTFVENFELSKLTLQVNGKDLAGAADLSYEADYENVD